MTVLSNIPPQALLPLDAYNLDDLRSASGDSDQTFLHADCADARDKGTVMQCIAEGLSFPDYFGSNLDAMYDCITDLQPDARAKNPGFVIVLESLPDSRKFDAAERNRILDVFRDAADYFDDQDVHFRVFFSVAHQNKKSATKPDH